MSRSDKDRIEALERENALLRAALRRRHEADDMVFIPMAMTIEEREAAGRRINAYRAKPVN